MKFFTKFYQNNLNMPTTKFVTNLFFLKKAKSFIMSQLAHLYITAFTTTRYKLFFIKVQWSILKYTGRTVLFLCFIFCLICSFCFSYFF